MNMKYMCVVIDIFPFMNVTMHIMQKCEIIVSKNVKFVSSQMQ